jgi:hypothetical protein
MSWEIDREMWLGGLAPVWVVPGVISPLRSTSLVEQSESKLVLELELAPCVHENFVEIALYKCVGCIFLGGAYLSRLLWDWRQRKVLQRAMLKSSFEMIIERVTA